MEEDGDKVSQRYKDVTPTPAAIEPPEVTPHFPQTRKPKIVIVISFFLTIFQRLNFAENKIQMKSLS
jgi:hypothetical protein